MTKVLPRQRRPRTVRVASVIPADGSEWGAARVLARRWSNRAELVVAALRHHAALAAADVPDTGTLRGDVLAVLGRLSASVGEMAGVLSFVLADYFDATGLSPSDLRGRILAGTPSRMTAVIQRAVDRGEIDPGVRQEAPPGQEELSVARFLPRALPFVVLMFHAACIPRR